MALVINPAQSRLGAENAVLWGRGNREYYVRDFPGPLSIKAVLRGQAEWRAGKSRFEVDAGSFVILNDGQPYSMTIEPGPPVETFCVFFEKGFVENAWRSAASGHAALLDDPERFGEALGFEERLRPRGGRIDGALRRMRAAAEHGGDAEAGFYQLALGLVELRTELAREIARLPAARASTRLELHTRVQRGRQAMDEMLTEKLPLQSIARLAHLSPFHFHRAFCAVFGETPHAYRTRRRLERASRLLKETDFPVTEVCLDTGFESVGSFSTLFRRRYGASPTEFRRKR
ncbi:MAG TPA: AraC family transcriptional regulator [Bryobacteraceae bacterium]|nr:AraC family transcriptional regulator [Bryobacteraceae bacterium]